MLITKKGTFPKTSVFLTSVPKTKIKKNNNKDTIVFVTKKTIDKIGNKNKNVKLILLSNVPSLLEFKDFFRKYPTQLKAYSNIYTNDIHFSQIIETVRNNKVWIVPHVKKEIEHVYAQSLSK